MTDDDPWKEVWDSMPRKPQPKTWDRFAANLIGTAIGVGIGKAVSHGATLISDAKDAAARQRERALVSQSHDELYDIASKIHATLEYPDGENFTIQFVRAWAKEDDEGVCPIGPLLTKLYICIHEIYDLDTLAELPPPMPQSLAHSVEGARWRDRLRRYIARFGDPAHKEAYLDAMREAVKSFTASLPYDAWTLWKYVSFEPVDDNALTIDLVDLMTQREVIAAVDAAILPFFSQAARDFGFFADLREQFNRNLCELSRLPYSEENANSDRIIMPDRFAGTPRELVQAYLKHTPFLQLFGVGIPFSLARHKERHWSIYARTGHGKSQLIQSLVLKHLKEPNSPGLIVIDSESKLDEREGMLAKIAQLEIFAKGESDRLVIVDPRMAPALNMFDVAEMSDEAENEVLSLYNYIFQAIDADLTNRQGTAFNFLVRLMFKHPGATITDLLALCQEGSDRTARNPFRAEESAYWPTIQKLDPVARTFFQTRFFPEGKQTKEQLSARLYSILSIRAFERMFSAKENKLDLYDCMEKRKVVLVSTAGLGDASVVFGRFIMALAVKAAYQRQVDNDNPCLLFIDEAKPLLDKNVEDVLTKTRKFGLFLRFATQHYAQLPDQVRAAANSNTTVKLTGGLSAQDARLFASDMRTTADFLSSTRFVDRQFTEFACFVQNHTATAVKLSIPLGQMEAEPKMDAATYRAMLDYHRNVMASSPKNTAPQTAPPESPPASDIDHTKPSDTW